MRYCVLVFIYLLLCAPSLSFASSCSSSTMFYIMQPVRLRSVQTINGIEQSGFLAADTQKAAEGVRHFCKSGDALVLPDINPILVAELCDFGKSVIVLKAHLPGQNDSVICALK